MAGCDTLKTLKEWQQESKVVLDHDIYLKYWGLGKIAREKFIEISIASEKRKRKKRLLRLVGVTYRNGFRKFLGIRIGARFSLDDWKPYRIYLKVRRTEQFAFFDVYYDEEAPLHIQMFDFAFCWIRVSVAGGVKI